MSSTYLVILHPNFNLHIVRHSKFVSWDFIVFVLAFALHSVLFGHLHLGSLQLIWVDLVWVHAVILLLLNHSVHIHLLIHLLCFHFHVHSHVGLGFGHAAVHAYVVGLLFNLFVTHIYF